jgi:hypothetical protein
VFGDCGQNVYGEAVGLREVHGREVNFGFHQAGYEVDVAYQTVELGDDEDCAMQSAEGESVSQGRTIITLA